MSKKTNDDRSMRPPQNAADIWSSRQKLPFIPTFSPKLNGIIGGGLRATGCYILTGAPGAGKSTFSLDIADGAINAGCPVIYVSAELSAQLVIARYAAKKLGMEWLETLDTEDEEKLAQIDAFVKEKGNYFWVLDPSQAMKFDYWIPVIRNQLDESYFAYHEKNGLPQPKERLKVLVIIDYIQDLAQPRVGNGKDHRMAVAELSRELRSMAADQFIPMWIISSSSRTHYANNEEQGNHTLLASAKDAGEVEYDSTAVFHIRRRDAREFKGIELVAAKNRYGAAMESLVFKIEPKSGAISETEATAQDLMLTVMKNSICELISKNPGNFKSAAMIAKTLTCKTADVKFAIDQLALGWGEYKLLNNQDGYFLVKK